MKPFGLAAMLALGVLTGCATIMWSAGLTDNPFRSECEWRDCEDEEGDTP